MRPAAPFGLILVAVLTNNAVSSPGVIVSTVAATVYAANNTAMECIGSTFRIPQVGATISGLLGFRAQARFLELPGASLTRARAKAGYRTECGCATSASTRRFDVSNMLAAREMGTAKFEPEKSERTAKFTPITLPLASNTGPPDPP